MTRAYTVLTKLFKLCVALRRLHLVDNLRCVDVTLLKAVASVIMENRKRDRSDEEEAQNYANQPTGQIADAFVYMPDADDIAFDTIGGSREQDVGICAFVSCSRGFGGILKHRLADFVVSEVSLDGEVAAIRSIALPPSEPGDAPLVASQTEQHDTSTVPPSVSAARRLAAICEGSDDAVDVVWNWRRQREANEAATWRTAVAAPAAAFPAAVAAVADMVAPTVTVASPEILENRVTLRAPANKNDRKAVHQLLRQLVPGCESATEGDAIVMIARRSGPAFNGWARAHSGSGTLWPVGRPDFCRFVLRKRDRDTGDALESISRATGARSSSFAIAGSKDRRGVTFQFVTAWREEPTVLLRANAALGGSVMLGEFTFVKRRLRLGDLRGNRFGLVVRRVHPLNGGADAQVMQDATSCDGKPSNTSADTMARNALIATSAAEAALAAWADVNFSFVNYYGLQRFGTGRVPTQAVGRMLLLGRPRAAVSAILGSRAADCGPSNVGVTDDSTSVLRQLDHGAAPADVARQLPNHFFIEHTLLASLARSGVQGADGDGPQSSLVARMSDDDATAALEALPPRIRNLYVHAYQSALWNSLATARLAEQGSAPVVGDLVLCSGADDDEGDYECGRAGTRTGGISASNGRSGDVVPSWRLPAVRRLTRADLDDPACSVTMADVVLPLPGFAVKYPGAGSSASSAAVARRLVADGFNEVETACSTSSIDDVEQDAGASVLATLWRIRGTACGTSLTGGYRRILATASDVRWRLIQHSDIDDPLSVADDDVEDHGTLDSSTGALGNQGSAGAVRASIRSASSAGGATGCRFVSLAIDFSLPKSAYATMALRELMRPASTNKRHQASLSIEYRTS